MGKPPDYDPTVPNQNTTAQYGSELEAYVGRENVVAVSGTPTTADAFPTAGRVAVDTTTDPDTYYIGDGSAWQEARLGSIYNPQEVDLAGTDQEPLATAGPENPYVLRVNSTGSIANVTGFKHEDALPGQELIVMGPTGSIVNTVRIKDNNASAQNAFQTTSGADQTIDAVTDLHVFKFTGTDWEQIASGAGN